MASAEYDMELTEAEKTSFEGKKSRLFKATIAVSVVYGVISLGILIAIFSSDAARALLTGTMAPFTITFVIGMFLIIMWLVIEIYDFKPVKNAAVERDPFMCPDYYTLERTPEATLERAPAELKGQMAFRCVPKPELFPPAQFSNMPAFTGYTVADVLNHATDGINTKLTNAADKLTCKNIYPAFLHSKDVLKNKDETNKYRCEFIGKNGCNTVNWTSVCPHPKQ